MPGTLRLAGTRVYDVADGRCEVGDVLVADGTIVAVETGGRSRPAAGETVVDLTGHTLFPGWIDAHAHVGLLSLTGQASWSPAEQAAYVFRNLTDALDQGFTTLRDLGGVDGGVVRAARAGLIESPRVLPSGQILSQIGGHGDMRATFSAADANPDLGAGGLVRNHALCTGPDQVRAAVRDQFRRGATQIKMFVTGGVLSENDPLEMPQFTAEEIRAAVAEAADRHSYVTVHAHTVEGMRRALDAGVRAFEHGSFVDDETAGELARTGSAVVPTLTVAELLTTGPRGWDVPDHLVAKADGMLDAARDSVRRLHRHGVRLGSGADLIGTEQRSRGREIALKAQVIGVDAAVRSATRVNAEILRIADVTGTIEPGKAADLVAYEEDVLAEPELFGTARPAVVVAAGRIVGAGRDAS